MDSPVPPSPNYTELQRPLENFRATARRVSVHPAEQTVLWIVSTYLVLMPWALGTQRLWAQIGALTLALVSLIVALVPRNYTAEHTGSNAFRLITWPKLLKFPLFWLGLGLLVLTLVQSLNPAWTYQTNGRSWWMDPEPHVKWLPSGVKVPFAEWGPWRMLLIYGITWLTVCAIWVGFTRRRTLQTFFLVLAVNGLALALFGIVQRMLGNGKMFWFFKSPNLYYFSSFIYKNHGAAYLFLTLALTCGIAGWYYLRGLRRLEKSNPAGVFAFFATCIAIAVLLSLARGATLVMFAFLVVMAGIFVFHQLFSPSVNRKPVVAIAMMLIFGIFLAVGWYALNKRDAWSPAKAMAGIRSGVTNEDNSLSGRAMVTKASLDMLGEKWLLGAGAGSYQFLFPFYQHKYPELVTQVGGRRLFWQHAHNDIVEYPIELGVAGMIIVVGALGYLATMLMKNFFWENPLSGSMALGLAFLLGYSWFDFPFHNVAVLVLWWTLAVATVMWTTFEETNAKG